MMYEKSFEILEISDVDSKLFVDAIEIYENSFPIEERQPINVIKDRILKKKLKFFVYLQSNIVLGICMMWVFSNLKTYFIDYYAIKQDARASGHGLLFLKELLKIINSEFSIVLEVEKPQSIEDIIKIKRIDFYRKLSFKSINDFYYAMPSFKGNYFLEMILLIRSINSCQVLEKKYLFDLVSAIYKDIYGKEHLNDSIVDLNKDEFYQII